MSTPLEQTEHQYYHQHHIENPLQHIDHDQNEHYNKNETLPTTKYIDKLLDDCYNKKMPITNNPTQFLHLYRIKYYTIYVSLGLANASDASEILCLSYMLSNPDFQNEILDNDMVHYGSYAAGSVFFGMLLGGIVVGSLGDNLGGRKSVLLFGLILNAFFGILASFSNNIYIFILCRWMAGIGIGGSIPPLFTLSAELAPTSKRGLYVTIVASFWMIGSIFISLLALIMFEYWECSWRLFMGVAALPSLLGAITIYCFVPESHKFYLWMHQYEGAVHSTKVLLHAMNSSLYPSIHAIHDRELQVLQQKDRRHTQTVLSYTNILGQSLQNVMRLYHSPFLYTSTISLQIIWLCLSFGTYGLLTWINTIFVSIHLQNVYFNSFLFALANLPGNILSAFLLDRIGRHNLLLFSMVSASLSLVIFAYQVHQNTLDGVTTVSSSSSIIIVLSACTFQALSISAWNTIDCMSTEMFPTSIRSTGLALCAATGRIGAMLAQFINGMMMQSNHDTFLLIVSSLMLLIGAVIPKLLLYMHYNALKRHKGIDSNGTAEVDMSGKALLEDEDIVSSLPRAQSYSSVGQVIETSTLIS